MLSKVFSTDEDKVFEMKYVRYASQLNNKNDISPNIDDTTTDGSFKFHLGQIHVVFLYKLIVQLHVSILFRFICFVTFCFLQAFPRQFGRLFNFRGGNQFCGAQSVQSYRIAQNKHENTSGNKPERSHSFVSTKIIISERGNNRYRYIK